MRKTILGIVALVAIGGGVSIFTPPVGDSHEVSVNAWPNWDGSSLRCVPLPKHSCI